MQKISKGFTVIELVLSIFVLSIAIIGSYNAFTIMDILTSNSSDRFTAAYLAQEGIEIIRNIRDTNWIEDEDWTTGLWDGIADCSSGCEYEADYKTFGTLFPFDDNYLCFENDFYTLNPECSSENQTKFKRKITITPLDVPGGEIDNKDILKVSVEVSWDEKSNILFEKQKQSITAEEYLYNWLVKNEPEE